MLRILLWGLLLLPALELAGLVLLAQQFGAGLALYLIGTALLGVLLLRTTRLTTALRLMQAARSGESPLLAAIWPVRQAAAGVLFIIPGVLTDILAVLLLLPWSWRPSRPIAANDDVIDGEFRRVDDPRLR